MANKTKKKQRTRIKSNDTRKRLVVFRSNQAIYAQIIDDNEGKTLVASSSLKAENGRSLQSSKQVGLDIAKLAIDKKIKAVIFDRNRYVYKGRVKALAEGAREGGLDF